MPGARTGKAPAPSELTLCAPRTPPHLKARAARPRWKGRPGPSASPAPAPASPRPAFQAWTHPASGGAQPAWSGKGGIWVNWRGGAAGRRGPQGAGLRASRSPCARPVGVQGSKDLSYSSPRGDGQVRSPCSCCPARPPPPGPALEGQMSPLLAPHLRWGQTFRKHLPCARLPSLVFMAWRM